MKGLKRGQSTLEWVIGAAIILGTLVVGIMAWNNGLVTKMGQMVQRLIAFSEPEAPSPFAGYVSLEEPTRGHVYRRLSNPIHINELWLLISTHRDPGLKPLGVQCLSCEDNEAEFETWISSPHVLHLHELRKC